MQIGRILFNAVPKKKHWSEYGTLCKTIQGLSTSLEGTDKGFGDGDNPDVFVSHLTPKQHATVAKLARRKCSMKCHINDVKMEALWDT